MDAVAEKVKCDIVRANIGLYAPAMKVWLLCMIFFFLLLYPKYESSFIQAAFDKLANDNADQKAQFDNQLAKAELDAGEMKAQFDHQLV